MKTPLSIGSLERPGSRVATGLLRGLLLGSVFIWAESLTVLLIMHYMLMTPWNPIGRTLGELALISMAVCALIGVILTVIVGRWLLERPVWHVHATAPFLILLLSTTVQQARLRDPIFGLGLIGLGLTHLVGFLVFRAVQRQSRGVWFVPAALGVVWYVAILLPEHTGLAHAVTPRGTASPGAPNVLWVVLDTTRADHSSLYGYARPTTPNLERLAHEGATFEQAYSTAPWTAEAHASMFTGMWSGQHWCNREHDALDTRYPTLAGILAEAGYDTALFSGNPWVDEPTGLARGFAHVERAWQRYCLRRMLMPGRLAINLEGRGEDKGGHESVEGLREWLASRLEPGRPFFAFVNLFEAHALYSDLPLEDLPRFLTGGETVKDATRSAIRFFEEEGNPTGYVPTERERQLSVALYDAGISVADRYVGQLVDTLRTAGALDNTLVVITSDHGELFGEHGIFSHDLGLYEPLLHVPLVLRYPKRVPAGVRIDRPVQTIDLFPTVLELAGLGNRCPAQVRGISLAPTFSSGGDSDRPIFAEYFTPDLPPLVKSLRQLGFDPAYYRLRSIQRGALRLISGPQGREQLFDIAADPGEYQDLKQARPQEAADLRARLRRFAEDNPPRVADRAPTG